MIQIIGGCISATDGSPYDYAMITVTDDLSAYADFNLGIATDGIIGSNAVVKVTGFPGDKNGKWTASGNVMENAGFDYDRSLIYNTDAASGESGAPLYTYAEYEGNEYYTVIGINAYTGSVYKLDEDGNIMYDENGKPILVDVSSFGPRMTTELLHFYKNNPNISWEG